MILTETTPNPNVLKFLPGCVVLETGVCAFTSIADAAKSPLAQQCFGIAGVSGVFMGHDFISVTTPNPEQWPILKPQILAILTEHLKKGDPFLIAIEKESKPETSASSESSAQKKSQETASSPADKRIIDDILAVLEDRVRPAVAMDGGDIAFDRFDPATGIVYVRLQGACSGCPSASITLKSGVENMLRHFIPEVSEVCAIED